MDKKEDKKPKNIYFSPVRVASFADLGRLAYGSGHESRNLFLLQLGKELSLCLPGEFIGGIRMLYWIGIDKPYKYAVYVPKDENGNESFTLNDKLNAHARMDAFHMPVVELDNSTFKEKQIKENAILYVKAKNYADVLNAVINESISDESLGMVYRFEYKGKHYIGSFDIITDDQKVFVYAEDDGSNGSFYMYDYSNGSIRKTNTFSESSYIYVRIINLASPMPNFKG